MSEEWEWIKGFEGRYQISDCGRLKSFLENTDGKILSQVNEKGWYFSVRLKDKNGRYHSKRIHRLVYETFIGEIKPKHHIHHKDGNKQNNNVENLQMLSAKEHCFETNKIISTTLGMNKRNVFEKPKHIRQYTLDNMFIAEYVNSVVAGEYSGVCARNILQVANKQDGRTQAGGFKWVFADKDEIKGVVKCD